MTEKNQRRENILGAFQLEFKLMRLISCSCYAKRTYTFTFKFITLIGEGLRRNAGRPYGIVSSYFEYFEFYRKLCDTL